MARRCGDAGVDRLAALANDHQVVLRSVAQWAKDSLPRRGERVPAIPKRPGDVLPPRAIAFVGHRRRTSAAEHPAVTAPPLSIAVFVWASSLCHDALSR